MQTSSLLIASPSTALRALLTEHFCGRIGLACKEAASLSELAQLLSGERPGALILDASEAEWLSALDGIQQSGAFARIILQRPGDSPPPDTARLTIPFRMAALEQWVLRALSSSGTTAPIVIWPGITLLPAEKRLQRQSDRKTVELTEKECELLLRLLAARGQILGREQLLQDIWGYAEGIDTHTLETHIYRLRGKINELMTGDDYISSQGNGYVLKG